MDAAELRAAFPVLRQTAYLNTGTNGPVPAAAVEAVAAEVARQANEGRGDMRFFERHGELRARQRSAYAGLLGCDAADVSLTSSTSEGLATVLAGLPLGAGDEILTAEREHPGLVGPLGAARALRGVTVREVPLARIHEAVRPATKVVACSHVSWSDGALAPPELAEVAASGVTVVLDGAQGVGAVPVDIAALGCHAYAGSGQKWCCGPDGAGLLYVSPALRERLPVDRRSYATLADPAAGLDAVLHPDGRRFDSAALSTEAATFALASLDVLGGFGWAAVHERAGGLATELAERLAAAGHEVVARDRTTLVSWVSADPAGQKAQLASAGVIVRDLPGVPWLRASVGAWSDPSDLDRLLAALPAPS